MIHKSCSFLHPSFPLPQCFIASHQNTYNTFQFSLIPWQYYQIYHLNNAHPLLKNQLIKDCLWTLNFSFTI